VRFHHSWATSLSLIALAFGLLGGPSGYALRGGLLPSLLDLRASLLAAGGDELTQARNRDDDDDDRDRWHRRHPTKRSRIAKKLGDAAGSEDEDGGSESGSDTAERGATSALRKDASPPLRPVYRVLEAVFAAAVRAFGAEQFVRLVPFVGGTLQASKNLDFVC